MEGLGKGGDMWSQLVISKNILSMCKAKKI